jgi:hypothetical protein
VTWNGEESTVHRRRRTLWVLLGVLAAPSLARPTPALAADHKDYVGRQAMILTERLDRVYGLLIDTSIRIWAR